MGNWGNGVWQDDVAADVLAMFDDLLEEGNSPIEALRHVLEDPPWGWGDRDDTAVQLLALAALALQHRMLEPVLRDRAIAMIDSDIPMGRAKGSRPEIIAARKDVLEQLKQLLLRGTATPEELKSVTTPEAFSLW